jgi:hypothetical protein
MGLAGAIHAIDGDAHHMAAGKIEDAPGYFRKQVSARGGLTEHLHIPRQAAFLKRLGCG